MTDVQKHEFDTLGFVVLRGLLPPDEMRAYTEAFDETLRAMTDPERWADESGNVQKGRFFEQNPQVYHGILEAFASEHSARMVAMQNATDNANEIVEELTLDLNKARQESITAELLDIVGGVAALED